MDRYYIKALDSSGYDRTGITFPEHIPLNLRELVKSCVENRRRVTWSKQFGWYCQPEVLCFYAEQHETRKIDELLYPYHLITIPHWKEDSK